MDDKLPKCGCGGEAYIRWDGPAVWIECMQYGHIKTPKFSYLDQAKAAWTRAMSGQAPGVEAMREVPATCPKCQSKNMACHAVGGVWQHSKCSECGHIWGSKQWQEFIMANGTFTEKVKYFGWRAALQAAERGKA